MKVLVTGFPLFAGKTARFLGGQSDDSERFVGTANKQGVADSSPGANRDDSHSSCRRTSLLPGMSPSRVSNCADNCHASRVPYCLAV